MHGKPSHLCNMIFYVKTVENFKINTKTCIKEVGYFKGIVVYETLSVIYEIRVSFALVFSYSKSM